MRIQVHHATEYVYDAPVFLEPHTFRLRPRQDGAQRLLSYRLAISPEPAGRTDCLDQDGNVAVEAWFDRKLTAWRVESEFEVETLRENPFDYVASAGMLSLAPQYPPVVAASLAPYLESAPPSAAVRQFAASAAAAAGGHTLEFLTVLNRRLFEGFGHEVRDEGPPHPPEVTLGLKAGTCRDMVVLFAAAARAVGIPTRFVSGYEAGAAEQDSPYLHAWAEVYLEGGGWRGYDPSAGLAASTRHVAVAAAAAPSLAAPIAGTIRGSAHAEMHYSLAMQVANGA
jgi:transglutaminase-like putative cysteine protease